MADELDDLLDKYDRDSQAAQQHTDERSQAAAEFQQSFIAWIRSTAQPTLDSFAQRLRARGHSAEVDVGTGNNPLIELELQPKGRQFSRTALKFRPVVAHQTVEIQIAADGGGLGSSERLLNGLTVDYVNELLREALRIVLENWS
jgi:hypothetical protein